MKSNTRKSLEILQTWQILVMNMFESQNFILMKMSALGNLRNKIPTNFKCFTEVKIKEVLTIKINTLKLNKDGSLQTSMSFYESIQISQLRQSHS